MNPLKFFYCYVQEDKSIRQALEKHLSSLRRSMLITTWHDRQIQAGINWQQEIDSHLESADLILPLVSSDFLRSDYCYGAERKKISLINPQTWLLFCISVLQPTF